MKERRSESNADGLQDIFLKRHAKKRRINGTMKERNTISDLRKIPPDILKVRYGKPNQKQREMLNMWKKQGDREIDVWYDPVGGSGKSWLVNHMWETGKAHYVKPYKSVDKILMDCASKMSKDPREYLMINISRAAKIDDNLLEALEDLKDGLIDDPRYDSLTINIRGTKIVVMTNHEITKKQLGKLSLDRWVINGQKLDNLPRQNDKRTKKATKN